MKSFSLTQANPEYIFPELRSVSMQEYFKESSMELHFRGTFDGAKIKFFRIFKEDLALNKNWLELRISTNDENNYYQKDFIIKQGDRIYTLGIGKKTGYIKVVLQDAGAQTAIDVSYE